MGPLTRGAVDAYVQGQQLVLTRPEVPGWPRVRILVRYQHPDTRNPARQRPDWHWVMTGRGEYECVPHDQLAPVSPDDPLLASPPAGTVTSGSVSRYPGDRGSSPTALRKQRE